MDPIEQFAESFLRDMPVIGAVPFAGAVSRVEDVTCILLYRRDQFQVQMFACPEGTIIPEHTHPNVDTIQVYVGGNVIFTHNGRYAYRADEVRAMDGPLRCANKRGHILRVRPDEKHGAVIGAGGGIFMAVQHWQNGIAPHCVAADYEGITMGEDHLSKVVSGTATAKNGLTAKDAATLEA